MFKKSLSVFIFAFAFFVLTVAFPAIANAAPRLYFDPSSFTTTKDTDFQVTIKIDVENRQAFGADAIVRFPTDITLKSVVNGGFFEDFENAPTTGQVELHGFFSSLDETKTGSGNFAVLTFATSKETGTGSLSFTCSGSGNDTFILDENGSNILSCNSINELALTYSGTGQNQNNNSGTGGTSATNACGGTCGSHSNCNAGLFCYQGFCRNPECASSTNCACSATPTPRATVRPRSGATATSTPKVKPTPQVVTLAVSTPYPTIIPAESLAEAEELEKPVTDNRKVALALGSMLLGLGILLFIIKKLRERKPGPPKIVNMGDTNSPQEPLPPPPATFDDTPYNPPSHTPPTTF